MSMNKRLLTVAVVLSLFMSLTACSNQTSPSDDPTPPVTPADSSSKQDTTDSTIIHSTHGVAFEVSADWTQANGTDMFYTDKNEVYGLNGVSPLGSYEPQTLFEELVAYYEGQFDTLSAPEELTAWQAGDGVVWRSV